VQPNKALHLTIADGRASGSLWRSLLNTSTLGGQRHRMMTFDQVQERLGLHCGADPRFDAALGAFLQDLSFEIAMLLDRN
jgi:hypothetical protein